jgi:hypothetical protein
LLSSDGDIIQQQEEVGVVNSITIEASCHVIFTDTLNDEIYISGYDYLVDGLIIDYDNENLTIDHEDYDVVQQDQLIEIYVPGNNVNMITVNANAKVESSDRIKLGDLKLVMSGQSKYPEIDLSVDCSNLYVFSYYNVGTYTFEGVADYVKFYIDGNIVIDAKGLECNDIDLVHKSINDCYLNPSKTLDVSCYSSGDTYYYDDPETTFTRYESIDLSCTGELIKLDE